MLFPVNLPPGVVKDGTESQSTGRFSDSQYIRWSPEGLLQPMGGWQIHSADADPLTGVARALLAWRDNGGGRWIGVGTNSNLNIVTEAGTVADITPAGYTAGLVDATSNAGYGAGPYGVGAYGTPRPDTGTRLQPTVWTLDTFGEELIAVADSDGGIYDWALDPATPAAILSGAPTGVSSIVVTPERFIMALKGRTVSWPDQESKTDWTPSDINQAGDLDLQTPGTLMCGRAMKGQTLLLTTVDAWAAVYLGLPAVYTFTRVGQGCGAISKQALAVNDTQAIWMSPDGFFAYDGSVVALPCEVRDAVFGNINTVQQAKTTCVHLSGSKEVIWFYPSAASTENDSYVKYNYGLNCWDTGVLSRTCGTAAGPFDVPLMATADGLIYEHETGFAYDGVMPFATTGPFKLGKGETLMEVQGLIPDELTQGDVRVSFATRYYPNGPETSYGPFGLTSPTDFLFQADRVRMKYEAVNLTDWRIGQFFLDVLKGDPLR